jgi:hypothetical protein
MDPILASVWSAALRETPPNPKGAAGELMSRIAKRLGVEQVEYEAIDDAAVFVFDLSTLGLIDMNCNIVLVTHDPGVDADWQRYANLRSRYIQKIGFDGYSFHIILKERRDAAGEEPLDDPEIVTLYGEDIDHVFTEPRPDTALYEIVRRQVPLARLCPYDTGHGARGSMFFDRTDQLDVLRKDLRHSYYVSGARRTGKSSLLLRAFDLLRVSQSTRHRTFYFDCRTWGSYTDCVRQVLHEVDRRHERRVDSWKEDRSKIEFVEKVRQRSHALGRPLLFFFDEMDRLVDYDADHGWQFSSSLSRLTEDRDIRVVFAGYRSMPRLAHSPRSPFYERLDPLEIEPFKDGDADELIKRPLGNLGIRLVNQRDVLKRIWRATEGYPFLVQYFGERLFRRAIKRGDAQVLETDVDEIEREESTQNFVFSHFLENTQHENGRPRILERRCAVLYIAHLVRQDGREQGWTDQDFFLANREIGAELDPAQLNKVLLNLRNAAILTRKSGHYHFAFPLLPEVFRSRYPDPKVFLDSLKME